MSQPSLVAAVVLFASLAHAGDFKAAYVDVQRAVQEVEDGRAARTHMQAAVEAKRKTFAVEKEALKKEQAALDAAKMGEDVRRQKEDALQKKVVALAQRADKEQNELSALERQQFGPILSRMEPLLGEIAQRDGLTMVFDKQGSALAWAPPSLDLTNELIRLYNDRYKGQAGKPAKKK